MHAPKKTHKWGNGHHYDLPVTRVFLFSWPFSSQPPPNQETPEHTLWGKLNRKNRSFVPRALECEKEILRQTETYKSNNITLFYLFPKKPQRHSVDEEYY